MTSRPGTAADPAAPPPAATVVRSMRARIAGLPAAPGDPPLEEEPGGHVMGASVQVMVGGEPLRRWGPAWLEGGWMTLRFRRPLAVGDPLVLSVEDAGDTLELTLRTPAGDVAASGTAGMGGDPPVPVDSFVETAVPDPPLAPRPDALAGRGLGFWAFGFEVPRDLAWVPGLDADDPYRTLGVAHPGWVVTGINRLIGQAIAMADGVWKHAGTRVHSLRPVPPGSQLRLVGRVERLFDAGVHHFADIAVLALADGRPSMVFVVTVVYAGTAQSSAPGRVGQDGGMASTWVTRPAGEVREGDRIRTAAGEELTVTRVETAFMGREGMVAFIEDTPGRWYKRPLPVDAAVEVLSD